MKLVLYLVLWPVAVAMTVASAVADHCRDRREAEEERRAAQKNVAPRARRRG